ncbi:X-Pro dipeptidase [Sphaerisporangium melleum]|uniref:X-Pro dipeptidase n=1 Tax=Sphaerisporangium melleum TaxID=321316 RepID=A0A917VM66_9ACTN|nr:Xaa-Pro peptidase family protein [Sphaerisporangium melleum]GGK98066.1 X-Pro dipeptidase [Sphaerisporangium melleum]GII73695.1 X-Pro dipeptidase [Sphaerisporangium melleum]
MTDIYQPRRARVAALLGEEGVGELLVTRGVNVRYLTGLASSNAAMLVRVDGSAVLATDSRYIETARRDIGGVEIVEARDVEATLVELAGRPAVEARDMSVARYRRLGGGDLPVTEGLVERVRVVKDDTEIEALRTACALTDQAFADVVATVAPGMTERRLARALEARMVELGADRPAFETIVASGPNGAVPHHVPGERPIERGDLVTMDFGALYGGYHADMTRTVAVGTAAGWQRELYDLVRAAQRAGRHALAPGAGLAEVDAAAREVIAAAGHAEHFGHGLGHGVGLEIHEDPFLRAAGTGRLDDRVPITVEPGVYLPGRGGVRIEDTLVTRVGGPELLTRTTKELLVL